MFYSIKFYLDAYSMITGFWINQTFLKAYKKKLKYAPKKNCFPLWKYLIT